MYLIPGSPTVLSSILKMQEQKWSRNTVMANQFLITKCGCLSPWDNDVNQDDLKMFWAWKYFEQINKQLLNPHFMTHIKLCRAQLILCIYHCKWHWQRLIIYSFVCKQRCYNRKLSAIQMQKSMINIWKEVRFVSKKVALSLVTT